MKIIRQLTKKGDPRLTILIPKTLKEFIKQAAKQGKRSAQDEVIRRIAASFKHEEACAALQGFLINHVKVVEES